MTGTSIEDMEKVGDDLLVLSSFITNSLGMAEAGSLYMASVVRVRLRGTLGRTDSDQQQVMGHAFTVIKLANVYTPMP